MLLGFLLGIAFRLFLIIFVWSECEWALSSAVGSLFASLGGLGRGKNESARGTMGRDRPPRACYFSIITVFLSGAPNEDIVQNHLT